MQRMRFLVKIREIIKSISLKNPDRNDIVVFDNEGSDILKRMILYDLDFTIIYSREERIYLSLSIVFLVIKHIGLINWDFLRKIKQNKFKKLLREIYKLYFYSCLSFIKPKIVVTFVDNSYWFQMMSRLYKNNAVFYAIQNGSRAKYNVTKWLPQPPDPGSKIFIPNFYCFGDYEKDLYEKYHHCVGRFIPVGSVRGSYYRNTLGVTKKKITYDICLVSEWVSSIMEHGLYPEIKKAILILNSYLKKYVKDFHLSLCIATRSNSESEWNYFRKTYDKLSDIIEFNVDKMSTYDAMDKSSIIVTFVSTAAIEAFGWGKKVLICNFSGDDNYDLPHQGIWTINEANYNEFRDRLNYLREIDDKEYIAKIYRYARYLMNFNLQLPAHILIRNSILEEIKK